MKKFNTKSDMTEAYADNFNNRCTHADEMFTPQDVAKHIMTTATRQSIRMNYGTIINTKQAYIIRNFGYVEFGS